MRITDLPDAREHADELRRRLGSAPVIFLDYDGTLTPIVDDPAAATIDDDVRDVLRRLAAVTPLAVVSGRDLADVRQHVSVDGLHYAGSHGFDIVLADGTREARGEEYLPALEAAYDQLSELLPLDAGVTVERKRFAIAVHTRRVEDPAVVASVEASVADVGRSIEGLRVTGGKRIQELRPAIDWDKGRALRYLLDQVLDVHDAVPVYIGDDVTDEDAFAAIADDGVGIVVRGEDDGRDTAADYALPDTDAVVAFLDRLAASLS